MLLKAQQGHSFLCSQIASEVIAFPFAPQSRRRAFMSTRPAVMGSMMSSLPIERHAAELMLLSVVSAGRHIMLSEGAVSPSRYAWF
jgi:hypothetical protein